MKECPKCHKVYNDEYSFCNICGIGLQNKNDIKEYANKNKNMILAVLIVGIVAILGIGITLSEQKKMQDTKQAIEDYKYEKAVQEYKSTPTTSDIKINSDWETERDGNYIYIRGSVTNVSSSKTISYFEVEAKFYDSKGNVIDSDWTNDGDELEPNETRKFEIMHKYDSSYDDIRLFIKDVN